MGTNSKHSDKQTTANFQNEELVADNFHKNHPTWADRDPAEACRTSENDSDGGRRTSQNVLNRDPGRANISLRQ